MTRVSQLNGNLRSPSCWLLCVSLLLLLWGPNLFNNNTFLPVHPCFEVINIWSRCALLPGAFLRRFFLAILFICSFTCIVCIYAVAGSGQFKCCNSQHLNNLSSCVVGEQCYLQVTTNVCYVASSSRAKKLEPTTRANNQSQQIDLRNLTPICVAIFSAKMQPKLEA